MIDAVVLAAGLATRMGELKPLIPIDGEPALSRILRAIRAAGIPRPIVVLGARSADRIEEAIDLTDCTVIVNDAPEAGMSRSLRLGLDAISPDAVGLLVFHADMPYVRVETTRAVLRAAERGASIAAPLHEGRRGFPVFFRRTHVSELRRTLTGDAGGRDYIDAHREAFESVVVDDPGSVHDVDRPADLAAWEGDRACVTNG